MISGATSPSCPCGVQSTTSLQPAMRAGSPSIKTVEKSGACPSVSGLTDKIILPGLPAVHDGLFHLWIGRSDTAFRLRLKGTAEKEIICEPVKAPLWHKHKRNGPCIISLNCCLGVRQSPFRRLCGSRHTSVQNPFGRWCTDG